MSSFAAVVVTFILSLPSIFYMIMAFFEIPSLFLTQVAALIVAIIVDRIHNKKDMVVKILISLVIVMAITVVFMSMLFLANIPDLYDGAWMLLPASAIAVAMTHFAPIGFYMLIAESRNRNKHTTITGSENNDA